MADLRKFIPQLEALLGRWARLEGPMPSKIFNPSDVAELLARWNPIREQLRTWEPLGHLSPRPTTVTPASDFGGAGYVPAGYVRRVLEDIREALAILSHPLSFAEGEPEVARQGVFFGGHPFDAMMKIGEIVSAAQRSLRVIDPYVGEKTLHMCARVGPAAALEILTSNKPGQVTTPALKMAAETWEKQHGVGRLRIRTSAAFHDRFVIVDDTEFYHFGASLKDAAVKNGFMFSRLTEPEAIEAIRAKLASEWANAPVFH